MSTSLARRILVGAVFTDLLDWNDAAGSLVPGTAVNGKLPMNFTMASPAAAGFLRVQVLVPVVTE